MIENTYKSQINDNDFESITSGCHARTFSFGLYKLNFYSFFIFQSCFINTFFFGPK